MGGMVICAGTVGTGVISVPVQVSSVFWSGSRLPNCVFR